LPIALIEAKDNDHSVGDGIQQGLDYARTLDIPFVFSSNGDGFVFHDRTAFGLKADYPIFVPNYSVQRSTLALSAGLGRKAAESAAAKKVAAKSRAEEKPRR
jgi:type I restriction enzyme R subunit